MGVRCVMESDFTSLIEDAKKGDPAALSRLYAEYVADALPAVSRRLRGALRRGYDTLDIGHSVFLEVLRDLPRFEDRGEVAFRRWVRIKARSEVDGKLRKLLKPKGGRRELTLLSVAAERARVDGPGPLEQSIHGEAGRSLRRALARLKERQQLVLRLRHEESLSFSEIAVCMEFQSPDAARKHYARALLKLRGHYATRSS